jgi:hypothetical protein
VSWLGEGVDACSEEWLSHEHGGRGGWVGLSAPRDGYYYGYRRTR